MAYTVVFLNLLVHSLKFVAALSSIPSGYRSLNINMPDVSPRVHDSYLCTAKKLNTAESYIIQYEPDADGTKAHHMLLFGCSGLQSQTKVYPSYWKCGGELCTGMTIIYGWAKNAPSMKLPPNVGHLVGGNSSIQYLVLQIHYASAFPEGMTDNSGLKLHLTTERQPFITGIYLLMSQSAVIPPYRPKFYIDVNCKFQGTTPIHVFAYRVHTHKLGTVVSGYKLSVQNNSWSFVAKGNPQWPQAFYPVEQVQTVTNSDILASRCTYNSSGISYPTHIGSTANDEMCNLYLMYYTEYRNSYSEQIPPCIGVEYNDLSGLPPGNDQTLPRNLILEQQVHATHGHGTAITYSNVAPGIVFNNQPGATHSHFSDWNNMGQISDDNTSHSKRIFNEVQDTGKSSSSSPKYNVISKWPSSDFSFGQISAVAINKNGNVVIFHRGSHVWNELTFDYFNNYLRASDGPISVPTVVTIDSVSGLLLHNWGKNLFYIPHGLSFDSHGNYWLTDVALHQIFCFPPNGGEKPLLVLGKKFVPGSDTEHFCKPTSVAVNKNGDIFVADGYCNSRVIKFSSTGKYLNQWGEKSNMFDRHPPVGTFNLPHKIILLEDRNMFCVADRENGRIQCFHMNGDFHFQIQREEFGGSLFSVAYSQNKGLLLAVCGRNVNDDHPVKAFVFNVTNQQLLTVFSPKSGTFSMPHDIAVSSDGEEAYVCEIGPNTVWKFLREVHKSMKKVLSSESLPSKPVHHEPTHSLPVEESNGYNHILSSDAVDDEAKNFETSIVIMALLGIPILLLILITVIIRLRKRGRLQSVSFGHLKGWMGGYKTPHPQEKFNLGHFLNPHKGFDKVAIVESDGDEDGAGSDAEEFCVNAKNA